VSTNHDDQHSQPADRDVAPEGIAGPLTPSETAAALYRDRWGWPVFSSTYTVWLRLPATIAAISIVIPDSRHTELLPALDDITGPIIDYSHGHYTILTHCTTLDADHIGTDQHDSPVIHLGLNTPIDLPPSIVAGTNAVWLHAPIDDQPLPDCAATLMLARHLLANQ
jgi:hypothetical protein